MASSEPTLTVSATPTSPATVPSMTTSMVVLPCCSNATSCSSRISYLIKRSLRRRRVPMSTACPSTVTSRPRPAIARTYSGATPSTNFRSFAPSTMAAARGCSEPCSASATRRSMSSVWKVLSERTSVSSGFPLVMVPVLSSRTARTA